MASRFDERAKALARGVTRRQALRGVLGGIAGAVAATFLTNVRTDPAQASAPASEAASAPLRQARPRLKQTTPVINSTGLELNQKPGFNQGRRARPNLNQRRQAGLNQFTSQSLTQRWGGKVQRKPGVNQVRPRPNNQQSGGRP